MNDFQEIHVSELRFLREQDGPNERLLKQELILLFNDSEHIESAYLVRAAYGSDSLEAVALCIESMIENDIDLVTRIQRTFAAIFSKKEHLDILYMNTDQKTVIAKVCLPFYVRRATTISGN